MTDKKQTSENISSDGKKQDPSDIYFGDSTLQTPEEHKEDEATDPEKDNEITLGND
jgi:hypothetical protein